MSSLRPFVMAAGTLLVLYLCWRMVSPFLPALCWAFALTLILDPAYQWLLRRGLPRGLAALAIIVLTGVLLVGPSAALASALAKEASDIMNRGGSAARIKDV
jgi:predicted PurR-regulated permease PerM